ncbi:hypothetical protein [Mobilicoccus caccae]|nr:hypothetical protein [Mobilicoccus caccae]
MTPLCIRSVISRSGSVTGLWARMYCADTSRGLPTNASAFSLVHTPP